MRDMEDKYTAQFTFAINSLDDLAKALYCASLAEADYKADLREAICSASNKFHDALHALHKGAEVEEILAHVESGFDALLALIKFELDPATESIRCAMCIVIGHHKLVKPREHLHMVLEKAGEAHV